MLRKNGKSWFEGADKRSSFGFRREMLLRIVAVEKMFPTLRGPPAGTYCNRATETIELFPDGDLDLNAIEASLAVLEAGPAHPPSTATRAMEAATRLNWFADRIKADVTRQADAFDWKASKAGSLRGKTDIRMLFYYVFADRLLAVAYAAFDWLSEPEQNLKLRVREKTAANIGVEEIDLPHLIRIDRTRSNNPSMNGRPANWPIVSRAHHGKTRLVREQVTP